MYINDVHVEGFQSVKYADDSSFYLPVLKQSVFTILPAIQQTQTWSEKNSMQLNTGKTHVINFHLNHQVEHRDPLQSDDYISIEPSSTVKFLGSLVDNFLTFIDHVEFLVEKCSSKLFLMRQLKRLGMNDDGLKLFYCANIRSVLTYGSQVFLYTIIRFYESKT
jgi:hypothetical protein